MTCVRPRIIVLCLLITSLWAQNKLNPKFDPNLPEHFAYPLIVQGMSDEDRAAAEKFQEMSATHLNTRRGDMADAYQIQMQLAQYWMAHQKPAIAQLCLSRAQVALRAQQSTNGGQPQAVENSASSAAGPQLSPAAPVLPPSPALANQQSPVLPPGSQPSSAVLPPGDAATAPPQPSARNPAYPGNAADTTSAAPATPANGKIDKVSRFLDRLATALNQAAQQSQNGAAGAQGGNSSAAYSAPPPAALPNSGPPASGPDVAYPAPAPSPTAIASGPYAASTAGSQGAFAASRRYYAMNNGALEKWDFNQDGTFLYQRVAAGAGASVRNSQRGTYQIQGNVLQLQITSNAGAFLTAGTSSSGNTANQGGYAGNSSQTQQMNIQLLGPDGQDGVVLNGITFKVRSWE